MKTSVLSANPSEIKTATNHPILGWGDWLALLQETMAAYNTHRVPKMSAALSYYTAFSLAPLVVLILSIASLAVQKDVARQAIISQVNNLMGSQGVSVVQGILDQSASTASASWGTALSFIVLLLGASAAFGELQDSLNQVWEVPPQKHPWLGMLKDRALSFAMVFVLGFFMMVSLVASALIAGLSALISFQLPPVYWELANVAISFLVFSALFAVIFWMLPDVDLKWRDVWPGAVFSAVLFIVGKLLLGWYLGRSAFFSSYGAAGSFIVILAWVFYSSQILFLGAEFARAYAQKRAAHLGKTLEITTPASSAKPAPAV